MNFHDFCRMLLVLGIGCAGVVTLAPPSAKVHQLQMEVTVLEKAREHQDEKIVEMRRSLEALKRGDCAAVEREAREKYGYCRSGEQIYHFE